MVNRRWIDLAGAVNVRDVGGLPARDGATTRFGRLLRADNLQGLTTDDVVHLVDTIGVRDVVDLRTSIEVEAEGPGPLTKRSEVRIHHHSLFPEAGTRTDVEAADAVLPWARPEEAGNASDSTGLYYTRYLARRPDSVLAALRTMAGSDGATIAHCAAGKDRTGVIVAMALSVADVDREAIVADYVATGERIAEIIARLRGTDTYASDLDGSSLDAHRPRPQAMRTFLRYLDIHCDGPLGWLTSHGWTDADSEALRARLLA
ncbi:MAG: tyrosine-protein phosphatase [Actinomycetota bacterium]